MKWPIIILVILLIQSVYSQCSNDQININIASKKELDELYGIGEVKAQAIIDERPFDSVGDLINVYGIGEKTLEKILNQGLACVDTGVEKEKINKEIQEDLTQDDLVKTSIQKQEKKKEPIQVIKLNSKDIKTDVGEENKEVAHKNNYAVYGLIVFCLILGLLFYRKRRQVKKYGLD